MPKKNTDSATIKQKCNNKEKLGVMEHFDTDVNLAWTKPAENVERFSGAIRP